MAVLAIEPTQIYAGDTAEWTIGPDEPILAGSGTQFDSMFSGAGIMGVTFARGSGLMQDFPPDSWDLHYSLKNNEQSFSFDATADGSDYDISVDTSAWAPGVYRLSGYVTAKTGGPPERHVVRTSEILVMPNPAADGPVDFRTPARQIYDQLMSDEVRGILVAEYTIGSRHIRYTDAKQRRDLLMFWAQRVGKEQGKVPSFYGATFSL